MLWSDIFFILSSHGCSAPLAIPNSLLAHWLATLPYDTPLTNLKRSCFKPYNCLLIKTNILNIGLLEKTCNIYFCVCSAYKIFVKNILAKHNVKSVCSRGQLFLDWILQTTPKMICLILKIWWSDNWPRAGVATFSIVSRIKKM